MRLNRKLVATMPGFRRPLFLFLLVLASMRAMADPFAIFPDQKELRSPDGSFVIRNEELAGARSEFTGMFHALALQRVGGGESRTLYAYVGRVAVAWAGNNQIILTDYVSKRSSRAVLLSTDPNIDAVILDKVRLASLLDWSTGVHLRENEHVFVEAARLDGTDLALTVWGYGSRDPKGFRWDCRYDLNNGRASCREKGEGRGSP